LGARKSTSLKLKFELCCHSNATRAPIANPPNSAQLGGIPSTLPSYIRFRAIVWACGCGQTDTHTDACDHNTFRVVYTVQTPTAGRRYTVTPVSVFSLINMRHNCRLEGSTALKLFSNKIFKFLTGSVSQQVDT